jgi:hypothetical protein
MISRFIPQIPSDRSPTKRNQTSPAFSTADLGVLFLTELRWAEKSTDCTASFPA